MQTSEEKELRKAIDRITETAEHFGLDFYPMRYEICPADIIYTFGAYGMPTRFPHWTFGKNFHKMKVHYDLGLSKIYELVINSNPCYAFLLDNNSLVQNKLIVAHVLAHSDFFKNNIRFAGTRKDMVESMAAAAERISRYEELYGRRRVEAFLDAVLSVQEHIDPSLIRREGEEEEAAESVKEFTGGPYDDLLELGERPEPEEAPSEKKKFPVQEEKDLLLFIEEHSRELEDWQRDVLTMIREEMLYFWPQLETKIMNEGWASFWHARIMRELDLAPEESIEFAKLNAGVIQPSRTSVNPYHLGLRIFETIEKRWDHPDESLQRAGVKPGSGRDKLFEVRELETDTSFIRNYVTKELVQQEDMYVFQKQGRDYTIVDKEWQQVKDQLIRSRVNGGFPYLVVSDGDYEKRGELYITHRYEEEELDVTYLEKTLPYLYQLWGRSVHVETVLDNKPTLFTYNGTRVFRKGL
ncbi:SpoVR family protein [Salibacterium halotolerans]|uniref:Stage V sporulation protein R n=1 Tax=Salibacterium halotolerans TaxID=1884432 RepID=A0A1I5UIJ6_9BACI|nr:SpoVR family protein [Salibacterium halotolerans]SFP95060.1 stage V sporulation protein R [Salibacterium halotolerans]